MIIHRINNETILNLKKYITKGKFDYIIDVISKQSFKTLLIYPTDDFFLTNYQFDCIKSMLNNEETLCIMQMNWKLKEGFFDQENVVYQFTNSDEYSEYVSLPIDTISIIFPSSFDWLIITDELSQNGVGLFIGGDNSFKRFSSIYKGAQSDLARFVYYYLNEYEKRHIQLSQLYSFLSICENKK